MSLTHITLLPPYPHSQPGEGFGKKLKNFFTWIKATRPARVINHWAQQRGGTLASGLAYSALFSSFAALLVFFSVVGLVLGNNQELRAEIIKTLAEIVPGLIAINGGSGVVDAEQLLQLDARNSFTLAGIIALTSTLWTAMNFLNGSRLAIRAMFKLPAMPEKNMLVTRLVDLAFMASGAIMLVLAVAVIAAGTGTANWLLRDVAGVELSNLLTVVIQLLGVVITIPIYTVIVAAMIRILAQIRVPKATLWSGSAIGGVAVGAITYLGSALLGSASANPLIATFATILGVLIFFNFVCMILLIAAAWVKVTMDDLGQAPRILDLEKAEEIALDAELDSRRRRLAATRIRLESELLELPRWRRRNVRRNYEHIIREQAKLEHTIRVRQFGYDPLKAQAQRKDADIHLRR